jgi:hypothetical protein
MRLTGTLFLSVATATMTTLAAAQEAGFSQRMIDRMCSLNKQPVDENPGVDRLSRRLNLTDARR